MSDKFIKEYCDKIILSSHHPNSFSKEIEEKIEKYQQEIRIKKTNEIVSKKTLEQKIEESMAENNLKIEAKDENNKWVISEIGD